MVIEIPEFAVWLAILCIVPPLIEITDSRLGRKYSNVLLSISAASFAVACIEQIATTIISIAKAF